MAQKEYLTRADLFLPYIKQIKALGYRVFISKDEYWQTYCFISDEQGRMGSCQLDDYDRGCRFSTKHRPTHDFGAGFAIQMPGEPVFEVTREHIEESLSLAPEWAIRQHGLPKLMRCIRKWTIDEYLNSSWFAGDNYIEYMED